MEFTVRGITSEGGEVTLAWRDGELSGPEREVGMVRAAAEDLDFLPMGEGRGGHAASYGGHLNSPSAVHVLMRRFVFKEVIEERGAIPTPSDLPGAPPSGAIH